MKRRLVSVVMGLALVCSVGLVSGQTADGEGTVNPTTNGVPEQAGTIWDFILSTSTNWYAGVYTIYDSGSESFGGGVGLSYKLEAPVVQDMLMPTLRLDYVDETVWMVNGGLQLQLPRSVMGKFPVRPFAEAAVAVPFSGGDENGDIVTIVGAGATVSFSKRVGLIGGVEFWDGAGFSRSQPQYRLGAWINF